MKRITDSLLKRIVRQSLNESYGLLNEETYTLPYFKNSETGEEYRNIEISVNPCPDEGFCFTGDNSLYNASELSKSLSPVSGAIETGNRLGVAARGIELVNKLSKNCTILKYGKSNNDITLKAVEDIGREYSNTDTDEDRVRNIILSLSYPQWCEAIEVGRQKGYGDNFWTLQTVGSDDYSPYVANPSLDVLRNTVKNTEKKISEFWNSVGKSINDKKSSEKTSNETLLANAIKCGYPDVEAYRKGTDGVPWKCLGAKFTIGGGGEVGSNQVSFKGYECIITHPALINTSIQIPMGLGYKLNTGNKTIDSFIFGVSKTGPGNPPTDTGVTIKDGTGIPLDFSCETNKYIQFSLSTNAWSYDAIVPYMNPEYFNWSVPNNQQGKIVLTTDPDFEDDGKSNNSLQKENIKGFRHNLLTEIEYKNKDTGPEVGIIQKKLGLPADKGTPTYGPKTIEAVKKFQSNNDLTVTGIVDDATYAKIMEIPDPIVPSATEFTRELKDKDTGPDVVAIQTKLGISTKRGYGPETQRAVLAFQKKYTDLDDTGIVDEKTFKKIMTEPAPGTSKKYSGRKHSYTKNDMNKWIKVTPNTDESQLSVNNGYFKIMDVPDEYSVIIEAEWVANGGGGSTQKVLFGEDAKQGTDQVISGTGGTGGEGGTGGTGGKGKRSGVVGGGGGTVDPERQRQRDLRKKEMCDALRQVKQYLNNTKDAGLTVNCQRDQNTLNQIMMALTGESPAPTQDSSVNTQPIPVTDKLF